MQRLLRRKRDGVILPWSEYAAKLDTMEEYVADEPKAKPVRKPRRKKPQKPPATVDNSDLGLVDELLNK